MCNTKSLHLNSSLTFSRPLMSSSRPPTDLPALRDLRVQPSTGVYITPATVPQLLHSLTHTQTLNALSLSKTHAPFFFAPPAHDLLNALQTAPTACLTLLDLRDLRINPSTQTSPELADTLSSILQHAAPTLTHLSLPACHAVAAALETVRFHRLAFLEFFIRPFVQSAALPACLQAVSFIQHCPALSSLSLLSVPHLVFHNLPPWIHGLQVLHIREREGSNREALAPFLANFSALKSLTWCGTPTSTDVAAITSACPALKDITLRPQHGYVPLEPRVFTTLGYRLVAFSADVTLTPDHWQALEHAIRLRELRVEITENVPSAMNRFLATCRTLRILHLSNAPDAHDLGEVGWSALADALDNASALRELSVEISDKFEKAIERNVPGVSRALQAVLRAVGERVEKISLRIPIQAYTHEDVLGLVTGLLDVAATVLKGAKEITLIAYTMADLSWETPDRSRRRAIIDKFLTAHQQAYHKLADVQNINVDGLEEWASDMIEEDEL